MTLVTHTQPTGAKTMTKTQQTAELRKTRIAEAFKAWGIATLSVTQTMPVTAPKWYRVNVANVADLDAAKGVAEAVGSQYGVQIAVVCW